MKPVYLSILFVFGCSGKTQEYECCQEGQIDVCTCSANTLCAQQAYVDNGDGTCSINGNELIDSASE